MPWSTRDRHVGGKVGQVVFVTELGHLRRRKSGLGCFGEARSRGFGLRNEHPDIPIALLAGVAAGVDAVDFQILIGSQRRNHLALAGVGVEPPAVVAALHLLAVELAAGKRHAPVRAGVMQGKRNALASRGPKPEASQAAWLSAMRRDVHPRWAGPDTRSRKASGNRVPGVEGAAVLSWVVNRRVLQAAGWGKKSLANSAVGPILECLALRCATVAQEG